MIGLVDKTVDQIQSGNILWVGILIVLAIIINLNKISDFFEGRKKIQIKRLLEAINCDYLDDDFKEFLSQEIQREYFLYVSKIAAEKEYRRKLFEIHRNTNGNLPFFHFRRASNHLSFNNNELSVEISKYDSFSYYANLTLAIFCGIAGLTVFIMPTFMKPMTTIQALTLYGQGAIFTAMAIFFKYETFPVTSAKLIRKELKKARDNLRGNMTKQKNKRNLIPLITVSVIVAAPLIFILGMVFDSQIQLSHILTADSLSSWISALATVAIAVLTFVLAKETWYLREAQMEQVNELRRESIRPNVSVELKGSHIALNLMIVEIRNLGKGIARNVKFQFFDRDCQPIDKGENVIVDEFLKLHIFNDGMHTLGIGQKVESFLFSFFDLKGKLRDIDIFSPFFKVEVCYEDVEGNLYSNELTVDFREFKGITEIGGGDPLHKIAGNVEKLREQFERMTNSSSNRLHINTYTEEDRSRERKEIEERLNEYHKHHEQSNANSQIQPIAEASD